MAAIGNALKVTAALLAGAAFVAPCLAALDVAAFDDEQRRILVEIEAREGRDGPYSPALLDQLKQLIVLYRENESAALALVVIERALQVVRANSGLYSLEQVPLLWQRLESEEALDNHAEVWELEQELLTLARRHLEDAQVVPMLRRVADRQMQVLGRVVYSGEIPPQVILGCYYDEWHTAGMGDCHAGSRTTVVRGMLADAERNYADAIAVLLRNEAYSSAELRELEMELVRGAELIRDEYEDDGNRGVTGSRIKTDVPMPLVPWAFAAKTLEPWRSRMAPIEELADWDLPHEPAGTPEAEYLDQGEPRDARFRSPYYRGRQSLRRLYAYDVAGSSPLESRAAAMVAIADWDLLFSNNALATEGYALARGLLEKAGADESVIAQVFAPDVPVVLPSFEPNPLAPHEARAATGHIDVLFAITKYGRARNIEIREMANATAAARDDLVGLLRSSRFRPRSTDGRSGESRVAVRYYLYDRGYD
jgi:hypothetical protein